MLGPLGSLGIFFKSLLSGQGDQAFILVFVAFLKAPLEENLRKTCDFKTVMCSACNKNLWILLEVISVCESNFACKETCDVSSVTLRKKMWFLHELNSVLIGANEKTYEISSDGLIHMKCPVCHSDRTHSFLTERTYSWKASIRSKCSRAYPGFWSIFKSTTGWEPNKNLWL